MNSSAGTAEVSVDQLIASDVGPVSVEERIRFHRVGELTVRVCSGAVTRWPVW
jgi:hypothetical protein